MLASTRHPQRNGQCHPLAVIKNESSIGGLTSRYARLSEFKLDLLAEDQAILCIHRAIELVGKSSERATAIAHALMGLGPADDDLADLVGRLTLEQKHTFCEVLQTRRWGLRTEDASKTLAKLQALADRMTLRAKDLTCASVASTASSEKSSAHWDFAKTRCSTLSPLLDEMTPEDRLEFADTFLECLDRPSRLVFMKKMPLKEVLGLKVKHRHELLLARASLYLKTSSKQKHSLFPSIQALTDSILSSEECRGCGSAVLGDIWHLARCDQHVDSELGRFLLGRMQKDFLVKSPKGAATQASSYEHYPLMFAFSHLSTVHADQAREHLHRVDGSVAQARLMVDALAGTQEWDLLHRFLEREGYSRETLKRLLAQAPASWLRDFAASFVDLNSRTKTQALQAAVTALSSPRVSQVVRTVLGKHWVEPKTKPSAQRELRNERYVPSKLSGVLASILVGVYRHA